MKKAIKIGLIMEKGSDRDNMLIELQILGHKVYMIPDDLDKYKLMIEIGIKVLVVEDSDVDKMYDDIKKIKAVEELKDLVILPLMDKKNVKNGVWDSIASISYRVIDNSKKNYKDKLSKILGEKSGVLGFKVEVNYIGDFVVFRIFGGMGLITSSSIKTKFKDLISGSGKEYIVDLTEVDFVESVGVGVLLDMQNSVFKLKKNVKFVIDSERVMKLIKMIKLDKYFDIYSSIDQIVVIEEYDKIEVAIVDDAKFMRVLIGGTLEKNGLLTRGYEDPIIALAEIKENQPDIVLVDYEMPNINGIEFINRLKPKELGIPVIMLTTTQDVKLVLSAIRSGASDFLNKPFDTQELVGIIIKLVEENKLKQENERLFNEVKRREKELNKKNKKIMTMYNQLEEELSMASEIQTNLLPQKFPEIEGFKFAAKYRPSKDIGGDFYDFIDMNNGYHGLVFADVSGHGIPAALLSTLFKGYVNVYTMDIISPGEAMERLNEVIAENFTDGKFVSTFYLIINEKDGNITYCKAAQEPALFINKEGEIEELITEGQVLGLFSYDDFPEFINFEDKEIMLKSGEKLFLYTDGITEAASKTGEMYGLARLKEMLIENRGENPDDLIEIINRDLMEFLEGMPILDDLTMFVIERE